MTELPFGFDDLAKMSPAVSAMTRPPAGEHYATQFGFLLAHSGGASHMTAMPSAENLEALRREFGMPDWRPILPDDLTPGVFMVGDLRLFTHGLPVVEHHVSSTSDGMFRLTRDSMFGTGYSGLRAVWRDEEWDLADMGASAILWKWPLRDIASISVVRLHQKFKLRDREVMILGEPPTPGSKGVPMRTEGRVGADVSIMRFSDLQSHQGPPPSQGSELLGLVEHMAQIVAASRGTSATWSVEADGKDRYHTASFDGQHRSVA